MTGPEPYAEVIGDPVAHSKSPTIHNFWLDRLGIAGEYRATPVQSEGLADHIAARRADPDWRGCNVTMPLKQAVLEHITDPGDVRGSIGAANTVLRDGSTLVATNTDAGGFYAPISGRDWAGAPVAVVGTGGAARAVLFALARIDVGDVTLYARNPLKAAGLLTHFGLKGSVRALDAPLSPAGLLVNASALGMTGQEGWEPDLAALPADAIVYDIVTAPVRTPLLRAAEAAGLATVDGLQMLVAQAALAFELFFGREPPRDDDATLFERLAS